MSIEELIELIKNRVPTEEDIKAFEERCKVREKKSKEWQRKARPTKEVMDRQYTI